MAALPWTRGFLAVSVLSTAFAFLMDPKCAIWDSPRTAYPGETITLHCHCTYPNQVRWYFNKNGDTHSNYTRLSDHGTDLTFVAHVQDTGYYYCSAVFMVGIRGDYMFLNVTKDAGLLRVTSKDVIVEVNHDATLQCDVRGQSTPAFSWFRVTVDGGMVPMSGHVRTSHGNEGSFTQLVLRKVPLTSSGVYRCFASNDKGSAFGDVMLRVCTNVAPVLQPHSKTVVEGESVHFECEFRSNPASTYRWFLRHANGTEQEVPSVLKEDGVSEVHVTEVISALHEGEYVCQASNPLHSANVSASLHVLVPPKIMQGPVNQTVAQHSSVRLNCSASGVPTPRLEWLFQQNASVIETGQLLVIPDLSPELQGRYACRATNEVGVDLASAYVTTLTQSAAGNHQ